MKKVGLISLIVLLMCAYTRFFHRHVIPLERVGSYFGNDTFRDEFGQKYYEDNPTWISRFNESDDFTYIFNRYLGENYSYDYETYTYYLSLGYTIRRLTYREIDRSGMMQGYKRYRGFTDLGINCAPNEVTLYRTPKVYVESPGFSYVKQYERIIAK